MLTGVFRQPGPERHGVGLHVRAPQGPADGAPLERAREARLRRVDPRAASPSPCPIDDHPLSFQRETRELRLSGPGAATDARPDGRAHVPAPCALFAFSASSWARSFVSSSR